MKITEALVEGPQQWLRDHVLIMVPGGPVVPSARSAYWFLIEYGMMKNNNVVLDIQIVRIYIISNKDMPIFGNAQFFKVFLVKGKQFCHKPLYVKTVAH